MSGCGGGGGSSTPSLPGAPSAPGAPGATSAPSAPGAPSPSPTPAPGSTTTPPNRSTPSPMPTLAGQGSTIIPDTTGRFSLIQLADEYGYNNASLSANQIQSEAQAPNTYDAVWAAFQPQTWSQYHAAGSTLILSRYYVPFEDAYLISGHDLSWFEQNHPSWILFGCQSNGTPTLDHAWTGTLAAFGKDVPLDIHNPDVVAYQMNTLLQYLQANGYDAVAIDQIVFQNFLLSPNPNLDGSNPTSGWYGCGVYTQWNGTTPVASSFVRVYGSPSGGDSEQPDQTFINDLLNWVQTAKSTLGGAGIKVLVNHPASGTAPSGNDATLINSVDGVVDETGFTNYGQWGPDAGTPGDFATTLSWVQNVQSMGKAVFLADYYNCQYVPANCNFTSASQLSGAEADWAAATYAIANGGGLGMFIAPQGVGEYSYRPELTTSYGAPCGPPVQSGSLYVRKFSKGLAIVNDSSSAQTYTLPNHAYTDIEQNHITIPGPGGTIAINRADGAMLLVTDGSNGCS